MNPRLPVSVETEIGFRSLAGEVIHKSTTGALSRVDRCVHLSVQLSRYFLHTYLGFSFQELQQFLVFCLSSLCRQHLIVGNSYHRAESLGGSWSHLPVASMAGSSLSPSRFSLGSVQQQRPNKLSGLPLRDVKLQTQISKPVMSDSLCILHRFHTSPFPATHSFIQTSLRALL